MRTWLLPVAVFFLASGANASDWHALAAKLCHNRKDFLSEASARAATKAADAGKFSRADYEELWWNSCDHTFSMEKAALAQKKQFDTKAFQEVNGRTCAEDRLTRDRAAEVATASGKNQLEVKTFLELWKEACDFPSALAAAKNAKRGKLDVKAFHQYYSILYSRCQTFSPKRALEAQRAATGISDGTIKAEPFFQMWSKTCNFDSAVAAAQQKLTRSPAFLAPISEDEMEPAAGSDAK